MFSCCICRFAVVRAVTAEERRHSAKRPRELVWNAYRWQGDDRATRGGQGRWSNKGGSVNREERKGFPWRLGCRLRDAKRFDGRGKAVVECRSKGRVVRYLVKQRIRRGKIRKWNMEVRKVADKEGAVSIWQVNSTDSWLQMEGL